MKLLTVNEEIKEQDVQKAILHSKITAYVGVCLIYYLLNVFMAVFCK